ncbi:MAG: NACHT domain-containing protein [Okeania sp. SIO3I5]|uniref:adenylate/guanylate cyclase domain-containing protein n=1 Tax=Okeania sp. SIO3I5 TaxID=2607805 RepID=UPI0013BDD579|nr:adenylate/guanylate cyclase domain-containing protein [Okeania sp. SIO3I5]NEQ39301.1 NACHT domain-containing protein [Okeania sp. SIO3I5]
MLNEELPNHIKGQRTLAAILFTDAVSFSARMSEDEEHTLKLIDRDLKLMANICRQFEGCVLKSTGDGLLMYFASAIQAVACATEVQKQLTENAANLPQKDILIHRIGIHLGDVFFSDNDVMGNGVNIAARLQAEAEPGGICISQTVYDVVKNNLSLQATFLGEKELKNIRDAIPIYQILLASKTAREQVSKEQEIEPKILSRQEYRFRQILLNKVKNYWIKGVLESSLHGKLFIELGFEERLDALERPWSLVWSDGENQHKTLPVGAKIFDKFEELGEGRSLLILGEPGAGKTTTLLELAKDLIQKAELNVTLPIPVIFNLSSWRNIKQSIADWLVQELYSKYQVSKEIGKNWIQQQQLLLLLDGLDEVSSEIRQNCVDALNQFCQEWGQTEIVVCSRIKDYETLSSRLIFQGAVYIQPLSEVQIEEYLQSGGEELKGLKIALKNDQILQDLAASPLMLSIMTLAYRGVAIAELPQGHTLARCEDLFNTYIEKMFQRRVGKGLYSQEKTKRWLIWLAKRMVEQSQTVFLIERMQPSYLTKKEKWNYAISIGLLSGIILGGCAWVNLDLIMFDSTAPITGGLTVGLGSGLVATLLFGLIDHEINLVETFKWSWKKAQENYKTGLLVALLVGPVIGIANALVTASVASWSVGINHGLLSAIPFGIGSGLIFVLLRGLTGSNIETTTTPNQGIWVSGKNAAIFGLLGATALTAIALAVDFPVLFGISLGLMFGLFGAGEACLQHLMLRIFLYYKGYIPWNYAKFLDYATELIFLQKVGGGYIFIHRLLLEHFANKTFLSKRVGEQGSGGVE